MAKRLKILLTGSNGYLGKNFLHYFEGKSFEIVKFTRKDIQILLDEYKRNSISNQNGFTFSIDLNYDIIIHAAALPYKDCEKDPKLAATINILLTDILSEYCIKNNCFFIFFSSVQVYGEILDGIYDENSGINPISNYAISKAKAEKNLLCKFSNNLLRGSILRIGNVIGLPQSMTSKGWELFSNSIIKEAYLEKKITIKNNSSIRRNFLPINLLMQVLEKILNEFSNIEKEIPSMINVTTGKSKTLLEYSEFVTIKYYEVFKENIEINYRKDFKDIKPYSVIENNILKKFLSSSYKFNLDEPIIKIFNYLKF